MSQDDLELEVARTDGLLSLEQQVLDEYRQLANKLYALSNELALMNRSISEPSAAESCGDADALLTNMRGVERKMGLVYTLFKTAVYSLVLQSQEKNEE
ncbi:DASH complex, subunit Dad3 [Metschnikowia bicuspidata]|uniref:DASH complex subunit DAD3 n=1 Tax=Metschnikowia bicuspidata TaxID=27322 RepID=A0A4P9Z9P3_9ASCO|nr:DASH complex, subunit Dad3 [Metschnikowia bicuspidata]